MKARTIVVRLGEYEINKQSNAERDFQVSEIIMHERYDDVTQANDIALIKLAARVDFDEHIWPICLPASNVVVEGQVAAAAGESSGL